MTSLNEILDFAINEEIQAAKFYLELAEKVERPGMREVFFSFAAEEQEHKKRLEKVKQTGFAETDRKPVKDLKISDYQVAVEKPDSSLDYQDALIIAAKREKAAYRLYMDLASETDDPNAKQLFLDLAQEEAKHKLRFEVEYDEFILQEN